MLNYCQDFKLILFSDQVYFNINYYSSWTRPFSKRKASYQRGLKQDMCNLTATLKNRNL